MLGRFEACCPPWHESAESTVDSIAHRQQPVVPEEARRASGRSPWQQPHFNSHISYHPPICFTPLGAQYCRLCVLIALALCHHRGISTVLLQPTCYCPVSKTNAPIPSDRWLQVNHFMPDSCLCFKLFACCRKCVSTPWCHTFRALNFAAEFGDVTNL